MAESIQSIFGQYLTPELLNSLAGGSVKSCTVLQEKRAILVDLAFEQYIPYAVLSAFRHNLCHALRLNSATVTPHFLPQCFHSAACKDILEEIRRQNPLVNGYFNGAEFTLQGNSVQIW